MPQKSVVRASTVSALLVMTAAAQALTSIPGYSAAKNDRFSGGFPLAPVPNASPTLVAADFDLSGVGWSTTTYFSSSYKNFALLSPQHFLTAQHYEYPSVNEKTAGVRVRGTDGVVHSQAAGTINNLGHGLKLTNHGFTNYDLAIGKLNAHVAPPDKIMRLGVLDRHASSSVDSGTAYNGLQLFTYGRGPSTNASPRLANTTIDGAFSNGGDPNQIYIRSATAHGKLEIGDSGSPGLHGWTNPNGDAQLTVLGLNSTVDANWNYLSFLTTTGAMAAANNVMTPDGFTLRVDGDPIATWQGNSSTDISANAAWGLGGLPGQTSDKYVAFDADTATSTAPTVSSNHNLRGLYFLAANNSGFTISGVNTLTIGRGGVTNYDDARQTINAPIFLGDHQYWDVGPGGVTAGNINTNGKLIEIAGTGVAIISGNVSGSGSVALSGSRLELSGTSGYTGITWVHSGTLDVDGSIAASSSVRLGAGTRLEGTGVVSNVQGPGSIDPGASPGVLTAATVNPTGGLDFNFELTQTGSPDYATAGASGNDVLRVTGATPITAPLTAANVISVYLDIPSLTYFDTIRGGIYLDQDTDFLSLIDDATFVYYLADGSGSVLYNGNTYSLYSGPFTFELATVPDSANFGAGPVSGGVMQWTIVPEPGLIALVSLLLPLAGRRRT